MGEMLYRAGSGMLLEMKRQEIVARNIAGSSIPGYKREFLVSGSFKSQLDKARSTSASARLDSKLEGTDAGQTRYDFTSGVQKHTNRRLDFAFDSYLKQSDDAEAQKGQLFFQVKSEDGKTLLTKNGCFQVDNNMTLVTPDGMKVMSDSGEPIVFGADDNLNNLYVSSDGQVKIEDTNNSPTVINAKGFIQLAVAKNPQSLSRFSANYFYDSDGTAGVVNATADQFNMKNGYYEDSNSSPVREMNAMIQSVREYEFQSKVVKSVQDIFRQELAKLSPNS